MPGAAQRAWRDAVSRTREDRPDDVWIDEGLVDDGASEPPARPIRDPRRAAASGAPTPAKARRPRSLPPEVAGEVAATAAPARAPRIQSRLADAAKAYERDRYRDALQILRPLADEVPDAAAVRELIGLTYYRLGRWRQAVKELEAFRTLSSSYDQHPSLADCYRALGQYRQVDDLWQELAEASPDAALVAEGRIVMAGSLADRNRISDAVAILEAGKLSGKRPQSHHLRLWYVLADLYERAGEVPKARALFERVALHDPDLYDVATRIRSLA